MIGYGAQGHAHALNLRDSGVNVTVGLLETSPSRTRVDADGLRWLPTQEAAAWADVVVMCTPDVPMAEAYEQHVAGGLSRGNMVVFVHGFNIHYGMIEPSPEVDVTLVAPKGQGHGVRAQFLAGRGLPALVAVHQDFTGRALARSLSYADGIGCARAMLLETTFREETEADLFGEQAVLCGGISGLLKAAFDTLVEAGYQPEAAYFECVHELKLIADLIFAYGISGMHRRISDTAEWGDALAETQIASEATREAMRALLRDIQSGAFARDWIAESRAGAPQLQAFRQREQASEIESVGRALRVEMGLSPD